MVDTAPAVSLRPGGCRHVARRRAPHRLLGAAALRRRPDVLPGAVHLRGRLAPARRARRRRCRGVPHVGHRRRRRQLSGSAASSSTGPPGPWLRPGRGAAALTVLRARRPGGARFALSYQPDNAVARRLYAGLGFVETGEVDDDEVVARLSLDLTPGPRGRRGRVVGDRLDGEDPRAHPAQHHLVRLRRLLARARLRVAGVVLCVLILTIPLGVASFRMARYALWPFGRAVVAKEGAGAGAVVLNVVWIVLAGWWLALTHVVTAVAQAITDHRHPAGDRQPQDGADLVGALRQAHRPPGRPAAG